MTYDFEDLWMAAKIAVNSVASCLSADRRLACKSPPSSINSTQRRDSSASSKVLNEAHFEKRDGGVFLNEEGTQEILFAIRTAHGTAVHVRIRRPSHDAPAASGSASCHVQGGAGRSGEIRTFLDQLNKFLIFDFGILI